MNTHHPDTWRVHVAQQQERLRSEVARDRLADQARVPRAIATERPRGWFTGLATSLGLVAAPEGCR